MVMGVVMIYGLRTTAFQPAFGFSAFSAFTAFRPVAEGRSFLGLWPKDWPKWFLSFIWPYHQIHYVTIYHQIHLWQQFWSTSNL